MEFVQANLIICQAVGVLLATLIISSFYKTTSNAPLVGVKPGILGWFTTPYHWLQDPVSILKEGEEKFGKYGKTFRITSPAQDIIVLSNPEVIEELRDLPQSILSFRPAGDEILQSTYILHEGIIQDAYHVDLIRKNMTERLSKILPEIAKNVEEVFEDITDIKDEWKNVNILNMSVGLISRVTSRIFVGLPICQNPEYLESITQFSVSVMKCARIMDYLPWFLHWIVAQIFLKKNTVQNVIIRYLGDEFKTRQAIKKLSPNSLSSKSDVIQWILDATHPETPILRLVQKLMFFNFAALHTSSITLTHALYDLAANPEFQDPVCTEIQEVLKAEGGWTKQALTKMKKLDSVLRESSRMNGINIITAIRKVLKPHTFIDGTYVPKGAWVCAYTSHVHYSPELYDNPETFDGFRFYKMRQEEGKAHLYQMASPALDYLAFGIGKNSCPGRFFAANQLKIALAYILSNYKLRLNGGVCGKRPQNVYSNIVCMPDPMIGIELKARKGSDKSAMFQHNLTN
ncbi:cytochrome P450 [Tuber indicum]|nr:cytochrome P450 [Tuber indicum]